MGGSSQGPTQTTQQTLLSPQMLGQLNSGLQGLQGAGQQYAQSAQNAANNYQTNYSQYTPSLNSNFGQFAPQLNTQFQAPNLGSQPLDAFSQNIVSQGTQGLNNQAGAQNTNIANQFRGNQGLSGVLQAQNNMQAGLQANPMLFQAAANQTQRQATQAGLSQQAQSLGNQALLDQGAAGANYQNLGNQTQLSQNQAGANLQGLQNAALSQQSQLQAQPYAVQQSLLSALGSMAQLQSPTQSTTIPTGPQRGFLSSLLDPANIFHQTF